MPYIQKDPLNYFWWNGTGVTSSQREHISEKPNPLPQSGQDIISLSWCCTPCCFSKLIFFQLAAKQSNASIIIWPFEHWPVLLQLSFPMVLLSIFNFCCCLYFSKLTGVKLMQILVISTRDFFFFF